MRFFSQYMEKVPVIVIETPFRQGIRETVNRILTHGNDTAALEREIDLMVYTLYDLTYDEARTVDPALAISRADYDALPVGHSVV